jgi:hypothetical protein
MADNFYATMQGFSQFAELTDPAHYQSVPDDWYIVMTDVQGSTQAIAQGRYKEVNLVGAAAIIAILNQTDRILLPYSFGGDGATMLIPAHLIDTVRDTLSGVQTRVELMFGMELRAFCIPVRALYAEGAWLKVAKFHISPNMSHAMFQGNALGIAEGWMKDNVSHPEIINCMEASDGDPQLTGLECRWQPINSRNGTMISLIARVAPQHEANAWSIYSHLLRSIHDIYPQSGPQSGNHFPLDKDHMRLSFAPSNLNKEASIRTKNFIGHLGYLLKIYLINSIGWIAFTTKRNVGSFDGQAYLSELVANSDARKFDEMLRMIIDSTPQQQAQLETLLKDAHARGEIVYGLHYASQALMTCLVFNLSGNHIHFVDGADGGYTMAAQQMKQQLATLTPQAHSTT